MNENGEPGFLDKMEDERSAGLFLYTAGFSNIIVAGKGEPVSCGVLGADTALSRGLADAPQKTLALFADEEHRAVYLGEKEKEGGGPPPPPVPLGESFLKKKKNKPPPGAPIFWGGAPFLGIWFSLSS